jgi:hypothetical protein
MVQRLTLLQLELGMMFLVDAYTNKRREGRRPGMCSMMGRSERWERNLRGGREAITESDDCSLKNIYQMENAV